MSIVGISLTIATCSGGSGSEPSEVTSFHYTQTATFTRGYDTYHLQIEGFYVAPDSVHVVSEDANPFLEIIVTGQDAWIRDASGWSAVPLEYVQALAFVNSNAILHLRGDQDFRDEGQGPIVDGEPTRRYLLDDSESVRAKGFELMSRTSPECAKVVESLVPLAEGRESMEIVRGQDSKLIYTVTRTHTGINSSSRSVIEVDDYNGRVSIERPEGVLKKREPTFPDRVCSYRERSTLDE